MIPTSLEMGIDDETFINDGMEMMFQYKRGQVRLQMLTRSDIHLWTIVSSFEDGIADNNTLLLRVAPFLTD